MKSTGILAVCLAVIAVCYVSKYCVYVGRLGLTVLHNGLENSTTLSRFAIIKCYFKFKSLCFFVEDIITYPHHISRRRCWQIQQSISKYTRPFLCTSQRWKAYYDWSMCFANVGLEPWPLVTTYKHSTCCHLYMFWQHTPTLFYT